jgi:carboxyl-terminal processing protease
MIEEKKKKMKFFPLFVFMGTAIVVSVFYVGFLAGSVQGSRSIVPEGEGHVVNQGLQYAGIDEDIDFDQFWDVWNLIKDSYVYQPVSEKDMFYGALKGLVWSLGDPYSTYFTPADAQEFNNDLNGTFFGIGAEIGLRDDAIIVIAPLSGAPAEQAGLLAGDRIIAVDEVETYNMTVGETVSIIRGEQGTEVVLTVYREGVDELFDIPIVRDEIKIDSVDWEIRDDNIAHIEVYMFNDDTTILFQQAVQDILKADVDGIILDVRNNPGGLLGEAINLAGFWVNGETVVVERIGDERREFAASGIAQLAGIPTVVLVNGGSASGSEILAGALQDYGMATLIGEQTFGKGSVQDYYEYPDSSAVKVTIAEWLTPFGRSINQVGIAPDIEVLYTIEDYNEKRTPQLQAAIDFLSSN